jgi:sRNA-binding protein
MKRSRDTGRVKQPDKKQKVEKSSEKKRPRDTKHTKQPEKKQKIEKSIPVKVSVVKEDVLQVGDEIYLRR